MGSAPHTPPQDHLARIERVAAGLGMARQQFTGAVTRIDPTKEQA